MKYTLKNYQEEAVSELVSLLAEAGQNYRDPKRKRHTSVSLAAVTGAGKTVMAAAAIEQVIKGTTETPGDPTATFLWFSDSPDLNEQSKHRIEQALGADGFPTRTIDASFRQERLRPQNLYFINTQQLTRTATISRRHYRESDSNQMTMPIPDAGDYDIWQTLKRTIEHPETTLYLIIDEAHRGMKRGKKVNDSQRGTIIQRVITGDGDVPAVPVVWGISATPDNFHKFMSSQASKFQTLPEVTVDAAKVQESGLLKDTIILSIPDEEGDYDHAHLSQGAKRLMEVTASWSAYTTAQEDTPPVTPLMVVQVPDKASDAQIDSYVDTIRNAYPSLGMENFAHVLGDERPIQAGGTLIHHISPERVQETTRVRVLFAKEAISTGWDCPRAEVMVSFRAAKDRTHITQLMGRMVRTPLARRIEGDDVLSSVTCILPKFDREIAEQVAKSVATGGTDWDGAGDGDKLRTVLINPEPVYPDETAQDIWSLFTTLPTETVPSGNRNPIRQLADLAVELSRDGLYPKAVAKTDHEMFDAMQSAAATEAVREEIQNIKKIDLQEFSVTYGTGEVSDTRKFSIDADDHAVNVAMSEAVRKFGANLAKGFVTHQVNSVTDDDTDDQDFLDATREAQITVAALARVDKAMNVIYFQASELAQELRDKYRVQTLNLGDARASEYREIFEQADHPVRLLMKQPANWQVPNTEADVNQSGEVQGERPLPRWLEHLMISPDDQLFPSRLNEWEQHVQATEKSRDGFRGWFRNSGSAMTSLNIAYPLPEDRWGRLRPDFIFFHDVAGSMKASIVDPHGAHLADALPKLKGFVRFVEAYGDEFHRVESVIKIDGTFRVLDIKDAAVRKAILEAEDAKTLYSNSELSRKYS